MDLVGMQFGDLCVVSKAEFVKDPVSGKRSSIWECKCKCGKTVSVRRNNLHSGGTTSCGCSRYEDLKGKVFGSWKVLHKDEPRKDAAYWVCECKCGILLSKRSSELKNTIDPMCRECRGKSRTGSNSKNWKGVGEISGNYLGELKCSAKTRGLCWDVSPEVLWDLFLSQDRKCAYTKVDLVFGKTLRTKAERTASLDRIDSTIGYVENNVQWVHKSINYMKMDLPHEDFLEWCNMVAENSDLSLKYRSTLAELIDRLCITQQKEWFIKEHREEYEQENKDIMHDIDLLLKGVSLDGDAIRSIVVLSLTNLLMWQNETNCRSGAEGEYDLELTHSLNGLRNSMKNRVQSVVGGRKDYKVDCLAAEVVEEYPVSW